MVAEFGRWQFSLADGSLVSFSDGSGINSGSSGSRGSRGSSGTK